ncbi:MAG TPA: tetratricopeptide repeat protein [Methanosarcinaceae archaeon]|nr:tetratricopeptide repeat protein [Methanosarcinaceae archaeon]
MELTPEHLSRLDEMITLLSISDGLTIAFVRCNEPVLCDTLHAEIKNRVANEIFIYDIEMDENSTNLLQLLNDAVDSKIYSLKIKEKKIAFFVSGLNEAIDRKTSEGRSEALVLLNMMREDFLNIKHPLIIWINVASLSIILKEAQDFFSWRTTVFEFDMERREQVTPSLEFGDTNLVFLDKEQLDERQEHYLGLLKEYQEKGIDDPYKFADWNYNLGIIKLLRGYAAEALKYFEKSLDYSERTGTKIGIANSLGRLGNAYSALGQVEKAIEHYEQALDISREIGDRRGEGAHLGNLGNAYSALWQVEKAIEHYEQALDILREIGNRRGEGNALGNLGLVYSHLGQVEKAIEHYEQALDISREIGDRRGEGTRLGNFGSAYSALGQVEKAIEHYEQALAISREIGDRRKEGVWLGNLGLAHSALGQVEKALEHYKQALDISREIGDRRGEGAHLGNLGSAYSHLGQVEKALEHYKQALVIGKEIKDPRIIKFCEKNLR